MEVPSQFIFSVPQSFRSPAGGIERLGRYSFLGIGISGFGMKTSTRTITLGAAAIASAGFLSGAYWATGASPILGNDGYCDQSLPVLCCD